MESNISLVRWIQIRSRLICRTAHCVQWGFSLAFLPGTHWLKRFQKTISALQLGKVSGHREQLRCAWHWFYKSMEPYLRNEPFSKRYSLSWCFDDGDGELRLSETLLQNLPWSFNWLWELVSLKVISYDLHHCQSSDVNWALVPCGWRRGQPGRDHSHQKCKGNRIKLKVKTEQTS